MSDEIMRALGRIEGKMDGVVDAQRDHGDRLLAVEGKVNNILGWSAGLGAGAGAVVAYIKSRLGGG